MLRLAHRVHPGFQNLDNRCGCRKLLKVGIGMVRACCSMCGSRELYHDGFSFARYLSIARSLAHPRSFSPFLSITCLSLSFASCTTPAGSPQKTVSGHCAPPSPAGWEWQCIWLRSFHSHPRSSCADLRHQPDKLRRASRAYVVCPAAVARERLLHGRPLRRRDLIVSVMPSGPDARLAPAALQSHCGYAGRPALLADEPLAVVLAILPPSLRCC